MASSTITRNVLTIVGWKDNKSVYVVSNCGSSEPISTVHRWNKDTQTKIAN